jgi:hypothetical protein
MQMGFDVFNALDLMENKEFLEKLKFGVGDGFLQYYLYNWKCPQMDPKKVSLLDFLTDVKSLGKLASWVSHFILITSQQFVNMIKKIK